MRPREILAANLKMLMSVVPAMGTFQQITKASGVSNGTLDRIRRAQVATNIDVIEQLAAAFNMKPWQMLVRDLIVELKDGRPQVVGTAEWPFAAVPQARYLALSEPDRGYVQRRLMQSIAECEVGELPSVVVTPRTAPLTTDDHLRAEQKKAEKRARRGA